MKYFIRIILITFFLCNSAASQEKKKNFKRFTVSISMGKLFHQFDVLNRTYHRPLIGWYLVYPYWYYAKYEDPGYYEGSISYGLSINNRILIGVLRLQKDIYGTVEVPPHKIYFDRFRLHGFFTGYERTLFSWKSFGLIAQATTGYYRSEKFDKYKYYGEGAVVSASAIGTGFTMKVQWKCTWKFLKNSALYLSWGYQHLNFGSYKGEYLDEKVTLMENEKGDYTFYSDPYAYMSEEVKRLYDIAGMKYWDLEIDYSGYHLNFGVSYLF